MPASLTYGAALNTCSKTWAASKVLTATHGDFRNVQEGDACTSCNRCVMLLNTQNVQPPTLIRGIHTRMFCSCRIVQ